MSHAVAGFYTGFRNNPAVNGTLQRIFSGGLGHVASAIMQLHNATSWGLQSLGNRTQAAQYGVAPAAPTGAQLANSTNGALGLPT